MLPIEKLKHINQTKYEELKLKGFPADCLSNSYLDGIIISGLPEKFKISESRFSTCWIQNNENQMLDLGGCVLSDCTVRLMKIEKLNLSDATIYGTLFTNLQVGELDLQNGVLRKSSIRDSSVGIINLDYSLLENTYFFRAHPEKILGGNSLTLTLGGGTEEEVNNYKRMVKRELNLKQKHDVMKVVKNEHRR